MFSLRSAAKYSLILFLSAVAAVLWLALPADAAVFQTYDIYSNPSDGTWVATGSPIQRFRSSTLDGELFSIVTETYTGVLSTTVAQLRDRTAAVTYLLEMYNTSSEFISWRPTTTVTIVADHIYELNIPNYNWKRRSPSTTYTNVTGDDDAGRRSSWPNGTLTEDNYDAFVRVTTLDTVNNSIALVSTSTVVCDFSLWNVNYSIASTTAANDYSISIMYGIDPGAMINQSWSWFVGSGAVDNGITIIPKTGDLVSGYAWYARAYLCDSTEQSECDFSLSSNASHILAQSDLYQFIVNDPSAPLLACPTNGSKVLYPNSITPNATSTDPSNNITCNESSTFFGNSLCALFQYLFVPDNQYMNNFTNLKSRVENKPPFGYVTVFTTQIQNLSTATSTTSTAFDSISSAQNMQLASIATLSIFDWLRTAFGWFLWVAFVFYIYHRFKNFSLHG